jgi:VWFA-related protein
MLTEVDDKRWTELAGEATNREVMGTPWGGRRSGHSLRLDPALEEGGYRLVTKMAGSISRLHGLIGFFVLVMISCFAQAQTPSAAPAAPVVVASQQPVIKSEVRIVLVDVVVTRPKGEPVGGMRKEDFEVSEDGKAQTVSFFEEHKSVPLRRVPLPPMPANVFSNYPAPQTADSINVVLLDTLNTRAIDQVYARQQMIKYLETMEAGPRLAIFTLGSRLRMVKGVTSNSGQLLTAVNDKNAGVGPQFSNLLPSDTQKGADKAVVDSMVRSQAAPEAIAAVREFQSDHAAYLVDSRIKMTLQAFQQISRYLASFKGRKNLMWVSGSFPVSVFPESGVKRQYQGELQQTADMLTAGQVAVYPISAVGMAGWTHPDPSNLGKPIREDNDERASDQIAMETLAQETGGKAFYNTNGLDEALAESMKNGAMYYTLAYAPGDARLDGKFRRIQVKMTGGGGYKLAYRRGYYAENAKNGETGKAAGDPLVALMNFGMPDFSEILYKVQIEPAKEQPTGDAARAGSNTELRGPTERYGLDFAIAVQDLKLETGADGTRRGGIEVQVIAYDRDGKPLNLVRKKSDIVLSAKVFAELQEFGLQVHKEIDVPGGEVYLRTGVYDLNSNKAGTLGIAVGAAARVH